MFWLCNIDILLISKPRATPHSNASYFCVKMKTLVLHIIQLKNGGVRFPVKEKAAGYK